MYLVNTFVNLSACAASGMLNAFFMRKTELEKGIDVFHKGESKGKSKKCAQEAIK